MKTRKIVSVLLTVSMLFSLVSGLGNVSFAASDVFEAEKIFEAEDGELAEKTTAKTKDPNARGKAYITLSGSKVNEPGAATPDASYRINIPSDGKYQIWVRVQVSGGGNDSLWARFDEESHLYCGLKISPDFVWHKTNEAKLTAGEHTFEILRREPGMKLDAICITKDPKKALGKEYPKDAEPEPTEKPAVTDDDLKVYEIGESGSLLIEAEEQIIYEDVGAIESVSTASGKKAVKLTRQSKNETDGSLAGAVGFKIKATTRGSYKVWMRYSAPGGSADSAHRSIDGATYANQSFPDTGSVENYAWVTVAPVRITGDEEHTIKIRPRESGGTIDQFLIIKSSSYTPEGLMKQEDLPQKIEEKVQPVVSTYPAPTITPVKGEHPRLLFRESDLPVIKANFEHEQNIKAYNKWRELVSQHVDGILKAASSSSGNYSSSVLGNIEAKAFDYVINGNEESGKQAVEAMMNVLETCQFASSGDVTRPMGHTVFTASEVYDWCHALMTDEQRAHMVLLCQDIATQMEIGWPPTKQGAVVGHGGETQLQRDLLAFAVATYDEYPDIYELIGGRYLSQYVEPRNYWYQSHMHYQGANYFNCRYASDMWALWIIYRMSGVQVLDDNAQYVPYFIEYSRLPSGAVFPDGDGTGSKLGVEPTYKKYLEDSFYAAAFYHNPYLKYITAVHSEDYNSFMYSFTTLTPVQFLALNDTNTGVRPFTELPTTKYFGSPSGTMIARTGWELGMDSPVAMAFMRVGEKWTMNHHHLDAGSFQLYYKGLLAPDTGIYNTYGTENDWNHNKATISHNALLIYDPEENTFGRTNAGGQTNNGLGEPATMEIWMEKDYETGKVLAHEAGPDEFRPTYSYLSGDITEAYSDKVSEVRRSMVFFDNDKADVPALFFVMDKITAKNKSFKKTFLLQSIQEPEVSGNTITIKRDTDGYNGKLVSQTLYPKDATIEKVGGDGMQWWVAGKNVPPKGVTLSFDPTYAWGRLEISPSVESETDYFLNAMYMTDADKVVDAKAELIENDIILGASLDSTVAVFVKNKERTTADISFDVTGEGEKRILVAGIKEGGWSIEKDGEAVGSEIATEDGGMIYFVGGAGAYTIKYADASAKREKVELVVPEHEGITIKINGSYMYTDVAPTIQNGRTLVPMRAIFENLGADIAWDGETSTVTGTKNGIEVKLTIGNTTAYVNGREITLDTPATLIDSRTMVPVRFVSESLGANVEWMPFSRQVLITPAKEFKPLDPRGIQIVECKWSTDNGEAQNGYKAYDGDAATRWAAEGIGEWIIFELAEEADIASYYTLWYNGTSRIYSYDLYASTDGVTFTKFISTKSGGKSNDEEITLDKPVRAKYIKMVGNANSVNGWNSLHEIEFRKAQ